MRTIAFSFATTGSNGELAKSNAENSAMFEARSIWALALAGAVGIAIWTAAPSLQPAGKIALFIVAASVIAWGLTSLNDTLIALTAALASVVSGVVDIERIHRSLGHELVWLLIASFVISAVLRASGILDILMRMLMRSFVTTIALMYGLTGMILLTAFLIPSTSGRAALLLPIFLDLAARLPDTRLIKPLALLFPTAILLSAGGSMIGAGAHLIASDYITKSTGIRLDFLSWMALALPFALISTFGATALIVRLFVPAELRSSQLAARNVDVKSLDGRQRLLAAVVLAVVLLWISGPLHGVHVTVVALGAMIVLLSGGISRLSIKDAFKAVEIELIVFLAATFVLADALMHSGADKWLASGIYTALAGVVGPGSVVVVVVLTIVSLAAHLVVASRTARAAVLIPALALPLTGLGHDPLQLIMITVLGTGFCQTLTSSAKPVAVFSSSELKPFRATDLLRLSGALMPMMMVLLVAYAVIALPALSRLIAPGKAGTQHAAAQSLAGSKNTPPRSCDDEAILLLLRAQIYGADLYASGWWKVWSSLSDAGLRIDKQTVRRLYKDHDLVLIRPKSADHKRFDASAGDLDRLKTLCRKVHAKS